VSQDGGKGFYQAATYLGQHFKISKGILKDTACMAQEERLLIAELKAIDKIYPLLASIGDMNIPQLIKEIMLPIIENEGYANWQRDVVTDMAIKKGDPRRKDKWKKDKDENIDE
jgi:hypothetical protein